MGKIKLQFQLLQQIFKCQGSPNPPRWINMIIWMALWKNIILGKWLESYILFSFSSYVPYMFICTYIAPHLLLTNVILKASSWIVYSFPSLTSTVWMLLNTDVNTGRDGSAAGLGEQYGYQCQLFLPHPFYSLNKSMIEGILHQDFQTT